MKVTGSVRVPGDKSISHRALMFAALGDGPSRITRILDSADVRSTAMPGIMVFCVPATPPGSVGIRWIADHVEPLVEVVYTRSFLAQLVRNRQSSQVRKILPSPEISADGSGPLRMLPGSAAAVIDEIVNAFPNLPPPFVEIV